MLAKVFSGGILGLEAKIIEIEVSTSYGLRHFEIVGLPDKAINESKERVGAAIESSGFKSPTKKTSEGFGFFSSCRFKKGRFNL
jgi:magnesium chelatase family protein